MSRQAASPSDGPWRVAPARPAQGRTSPPSAPSAVAGGRRPGAGLSGTAGRRSIERALAIVASEHPAEPERHPARRHPHAGEPVVRPLLRQALGRPGFLGPQRLAQPASSARTLRCGSSTATSRASGSTRTASSSPSISCRTRPPRTAPPPTTSATSGRPSTTRWNSGAMDNFVGAHLAADGVDNFAVTMGYFDRSDLAFYYALADAFTICDALLLLGARPDRPQPGDGVLGHHRPRRHRRGADPRHADDRSARSSTTRLSWTTMPEQLLDAGVSWKVYNDPTGLALFNPLPYFKAYNDSTTHTRAATPGTGPDAGLSRPTSSPTSPPAPCRR